MNVIIRKATVVAKGHPLNGKAVDIQVTNGIIRSIGDNIAADEHTTEINIDGLHVSEGWFDSSVSFGEPGFEDRETIENGLNTAARSGFTAVALQPNNFPVTDNQAQVKFALSKANGHATSLYPIGALTVKSEGNDLAELYDMKNAGAVAFGDYGKSIEDTNLLKTALQYVQDFDGLVIAFCQDSSIKGKGFVNEGIVSTKLGMKGIPSLAEELQVAQHLFLLEYTGGKLHIPTISTVKSAQLIRDAKAKGLHVTCSVAVHNLVLTDEKLETFDTRYKVSPPLRTEADRLALIEAVKDGTIDLITSDHNPWDIEHKKLEFDLAKNGTIGLESAFISLLNILPHDIIVEKFTSGKGLFSIERQEIKQGNAASLSLFTIDSEGVFTNDNILSKSKNSAFLGTPTKGRVYGIINNGKIVINE